MTKQMELQVLVRAHRALPCLSRHLGLRLVLNLTVGPFSFFLFYSFSVLDLRLLLVLVLMRAKHPSTISTASTPFH